MEGRCTLSGGDGQLESQLSVCRYSYVIDEARDEFFCSVEMYDTVHDAWQAVAPLAVPRCLGAAVAGWA